MLKQATIVFFPRTDQKLKNGKYPIYARVVLDREKFEFSTKQFIDNLVEWDDVIQRIKKRSPVNSVLNEIEHDIVEAYNFLKYHNRQLTALALRNQLKGDGQKRTRLLDFVDDHYANQIKGNVEFAPATQKTYHTTIYHLRNFLESIQATKIKVAELDGDFIKAFDNYLINRGITEKKGLKKNSANKYHVNFKTMLFKAVDKKMLEKNPYADFKFKSEPGKLTYLTSEELSLLENHDLGGNASLTRVRDIFLFSVYTGLRHSDASTLQGSNIEVSNNKYWIVYTQQKTGASNRIPMLRKAVEIYHKYEDLREMTGYVLPRLSNQKLNAYLKVVADMVGVKKHLSHHVARHTAATTIFMQNGISLETTGKLLGHQSIKSTQIYAKVTNIMLKEAADKLDQIL